MFACIELQVHLIKQCMMSKSEADFFQCEQGHGKNYFSKLTGGAILPCLAGIGKESIINFPNCNPRCLAGRRNNAIRSRAAALANSHLSAVRGQVHELRRPNLRMRCVPACPAKYSATFCIWRRNEKIAVFFGAAPRPEHSRCR